MADIDYIDLKHRLENASSVCIGDVRSLLHPLERPEKLGKGWSAAVKSQSMLFRMLCRLSKLEAGPCFIEVCLRTAVDWLEHAFAHRRENLAVREARNALVGLSGIRHGGSGTLYSQTAAFSYDTGGRLLLRDFSFAIDSVIFDVDVAFDELDYEDDAYVGHRWIYPSTWDYWMSSTNRFGDRLEIRLYRTLGVFVRSFALVYGELSGKWQKEFLPSFWTHCVCRLACKLGPPRELVELGKRRGKRALEFIGNNNPYYNERGSQQWSG